MARAGPTQGAERHQEKIQGSWTGRPRLAAALRFAIFAVPLIISFIFSVAAGRIMPAERLGVGRWIWIAGVFVLANVLLLLLRRLASRLVPLVALMKLTLVFPDNAPSRTKAALRSSNSKTMLREIRAAERSGEHEANYGDYLVQLLKELNDHDRLTRGHSERVRAYSEMIGREIGLKESELDKLRWAALLHDVGKLSVPSEILNSEGRPTDEEWAILSGHPTAGMPLLEPLRGWLGDWIHAADQHHCKWDGSGYPTHLSGTDITLAGRIVAIADAYDVMTSARSYKAPLSPEVARQELTDCAGKQFDPNLVRAFLQIGLGRLKTVAGPLAWVSNFAGSAQLPVPAATAVSSVGVAATGLVTVAAGSVFAPEVPPTLALDEPAVVADDAAVSATTGQSFDLLLGAEGDDLTFTLGGAVHGTVELARFPQQNEDGRWEIIVTYTPNDGYVGEDAFNFEACNPAGECDQAVAVVDLLAPPAPPTTAPTTAAPTTTTEPTTTAAPTTAAAPTTTAAPTTAVPTTAAPTTAAPTTAAPTTTEPRNDAPVAADDVALVAEDDVVVIPVLANDSDANGDALQITGVSDPISGVAQIVGTDVRYVPAPDFAGTDQFSYTISDGINPNVVATVTVTVTPVNDPPTVIAPDASVSEDAPVGTIVTTVVGSDIDDSALTYTLLGSGASAFSIDSDGVVTVRTPLDHEARAVYDLDARVDDGTAFATESVRITVGDVDEAPTAGDDVGTTAEDTAVGIDVSTNDADPEGGALTFAVDTVSVAGGSVLNVDGVVTYDPPSNFIGTDSFTYAAIDPAGNRSGDATVTITVAAVNDAPVAVDDGGAGFSTIEDAAFTTPDVRLNDSDPDDMVIALSVTIVNEPFRGTAVANADGTVTYDPDPDTNGPDSFTYRLTDPDGAVSDPATVSVTVTPQNDPPVAVNDTLSVGTTPSVTSIDLRLNDDDIDGDPLTITAVTNGAFGTVANNGDGTVTYTHTGGGFTDTFSYTVSDPSGATDTANVSVTIAPQDGDGVPAAVDVCPFAFDPLQVDTDGDGVGDRCDPSPTAPAGSIGESGVDIGSNDSVGLVIADFTGDGRNDVVFANNGQANTMLEWSFAFLLDSGQSLGDTSSMDVAAGDLDGDGSIDLFFANDGTDSIWLNDGSGTFTSNGDIGGGPWRGVALADVDLDGDLDAILTSESDANRVLLNDGTGDFVYTAQQLEPTFNTIGVSVDDLDGDGDIDLVFSNDGDPDTVWFNDGSGVFTDSGQTLGVDRGFASAIEDLDGDGDLDIVFAGDNDGDTIWWNDGSGVFSDAGVVIGRGHSRDVAVADMDGDGDLDIVFGDHTGANSLWLNNGAGAFTDAGFDIGDDTTEGIAIADFNLDGSPGIVAANAGDQNRVHGNG